MQFKTERIRSEFEELDAKNPKLKKMLLVADGYTQAEFGKEIVLTCLYRSPEENDALYASVPPGLRPKVVPHTLWDAADLRSSVFTEQEIQKLLTLLNCFSYQGGQRKAAVYHMISGNVYHLHLQTRADA